MARVIDSATRDALVERLRFYRDLGLTDFYRRAGELVEAGEAASAETSVALESALPEATVRVETLRTAVQASAQTNHFGEEPAIKTRKGFIAPPEIAAEVPIEERAAALQIIRDDIGDCTRCIGDGTRLCLPTVRRQRG